MPSSNHIHPAYVKRRLDTFGGPHCLNTTIYTDPYTEHINLYTIHLPHRHTSHTLHTTHTPHTSHTTHTTGTSIQVVMVVLVVVMVLLLG